MNNWTIKNIPYTRPDVEKYKSEMESVLDKMESAKSYEEQREAVFERQALMDEFTTYPTLTNIRYDMNLADEFYSAEMKYWNGVNPTLVYLNRRYYEIVTTSPFRPDFEREFGKDVFIPAQSAIRIADSRLVEYKKELSPLISEHAKLIGSASSEFRGKPQSFYGLLKAMQSTDREERREAFKVWGETYEKISHRADEIFDKMLSLRVKMASVIGFDNYTDMGYLERQRYYYTPDEVAEFRDAVVKYIVPAAARLYELQRKRLGLDKLCYYDEAFFFPSGNPNPSGKQSEMLECAAEIFSEMSKETGEFIKFMLDHELFDLETRLNKRTGGYSMRLRKYKGSFVLSNFNGTLEDIRILTHESGHAFYSYYNKHALIENRGTGPEISETHSMSMELLTHPWMEKFFGDRADEYRLWHLTNALCTLPHRVAVDEFQHFIYADPERYASREERYALWRRVEKKYMPWRDYDGCEFMEKGGFWLATHHIFKYPFYYIEYALAQLASFEIYIQAEEDRNVGWGNYMKLCEIGGKVSYKDSLKLCGLHDPFAEGTVKDIAEKIEAKILQMIK